MYYVGMDVCKRMISYCVKDGCSRPSERASCSVLLRMRCPSLSNESMWLSMSSWLPPFARLSPLLLVAYQERAINEFDLYSGLGCAARASR
jgi:hypothetical protein